MNSPKALSSIANNLSFNSKQQATQEFELPPQAITIVNDLFNNLKSICTAWKQTFTDQAIEQAAKQQWAQALVENGIVNQGQIELGMKKARALAKPWFPSSGEFIQWCKPNLEDYGLPNAEQALRKVINGQKRSHPVLFLAAQATGSRELKTMQHESLLKLFTRNYEIVCQRFINGEYLSQSIPKALPSSVYVVADQKKRTANAANLRQLLKKRSGPIMLTIFNQKNTPKVTVEVSEKKSHDCGIRFTEELRIKVANDVDNGMSQVNTGLKHGLGRSAVSRAVDKFGKKKELRNA